VCADRCGDSPQKQIAGGVSVLVVDLLESIEVDDDQGQTPRRLDAAGEFSAEGLSELASVVQSRQRVMARAMLMVVQSAGLIQGERRVRGERFDRVGNIVGDWPGHQLSDDLAGGDQLKAPTGATRALARHKNRLILPEQRAGVLVDTGEADGFGLGGCDLVDGLEQVFMLVRRQSLYGR
jgi:hypothetical protein